MALVERRYAEALVVISEQDEHIESIRQEFKILIDIFKRDEGFKAFLLNPQVKTDLKKDFIAKALGHLIKPMFLNFLMLLVDKGRIKLLPGIFEEFERIADQKQNIIDIIIESPEPLSQPQIASIREKYRNLYNAHEVRAEVKINKALIGGCLVKVGDKVTDGTVAGRLIALKKLLIEVV